MLPKQPPWPIVWRGVSVRGERYLGTSSWRSRGTIWNRNGSPATKPTIEAIQGHPAWAATKSSVESKPLTRAAYSRSVASGSWRLSRNREAVSRVHGSP